MTSLLLALLCLPGSAPDLAPWPTGMSRRANPPKLSAKAPHPSRKDRAAKRPDGAKAPPGVSFATADPQPGYDATALVHEAGAIGSEEWLDTLKAMEAGLSPALRKAAVEKAETYLDRYPNNRPSIGFRLADLYFRVGRNADAYRLLAPLATEQASKETLLRASVAAALRGEVYPGQRAYCARSILRYYETDDRPEYVPQGETPAAVLTLSLLATAAECSSHHEAPNVRYYGGLALRRDPGNPLACHLLAYYASEDRRYAEAILLLRQGAARARGDLADSFRSRLLEYERLRKVQEGRGLTPVILPSG